MLAECQGSSGRPCPSGALMHHLCQVEFMDSHCAKEDSTAERKECIEILGARHAKEVRAQNQPKTTCSLEGLTVTANREKKATVSAASRMIFRRTSKCLSLMRSRSCSRLYLPASRSLATALVSLSGCLRPARALVHARASQSTYIPLACNHARVFFGLSEYFKTIVSLSDPADTCSFVFAYLRLLLPSCSRAIALASLSGNGVFRENSPANERTAVWSSI